MRLTALAAGMLTVSAIAVAGIEADRPDAPRPATPAPVIKQVDEQTSEVWLYAERQSQSIVSEPASAVAVEAQRGCPQFIDLFRRYGLEPAETFSFIAWRETRCNPELVNATFDKSGRAVKTLNRDGSYDVGLLQINSTWKTVTHEVCGTPWGEMFALIDLHCNLSVAKYLLENGGLGHWSL